MAYDNLNPYLQDILVAQWQQNVKIVILGLLFFFSLLYIFYLYDNYKTTQVFFLGFVRFFLYLASYTYAWLFLLLFPVTLHPAVSPDTLLIFLASAYSILFTTVLVLFVVNATVWIPQLILRWGKYDSTLIKEDSLNKYIKGFEKSFKRYR